MRLARPASAPCTADSSSGSGQLRVASGMTTQTLRPSRSVRGELLARRRRRLRRRAGPRRVRR